MNNCANQVTGGTIIHPDHFAKSRNQISEIIDNRGEGEHEHTKRSARRTQ